MWILKKKLYRWTYFHGRNRDTDVENKHVDTWVRRGGGRTNWDFRLAYMHYQGFPDGTSGKESTCNAGDTRGVGSITVYGRFPATHSSILAWKIPWTEESGGLQSMGPQRGRWDWATKHIYIYIYTLSCVNQITSGKLLHITGTQLSALWRPR